MLCQLFILNVESVNSSQLHLFEVNNSDGSCIQSIIIIQYKSQYNKQNLISIIAIIVQSTIQSENHAHVTMMP